MQEALTVAGNAGEVKLATAVLSNLASLSLAARRWAEAEDYAERAVNASSLVEDDVRLSALFNLAIARIQLGRGGEAVPLLVEVVGINHRLGDRLAVAECLVAFAAVALDQGRVDASARLLGRADAQLESFGGAYQPAERDLHDQTLASIRSQLSVSELAAAWAEGCALELDAALALATERDATTASPTTA
jgi:tetratricopeptide (TPR) repeat protein